MQSFQPSDDAGLSPNLHSIRRVFVYCPTPMFIKSVAGLRDIPGVQELHVESELDSAVKCLREAPEPFDLIVLKSKSSMPDEALRLFAEARNSERHEKAPLLLYVWNGHAQPAVQALSREYGENLWLCDDDWEPEQEAAELGKIFCEAAGISDLHSGKVTEHINSGLQSALACTGLRAPRLNLEPDVEFDSILMINDCTGLLHLFSEGVRLFDKREKKCEVLTAFSPLDGIELFRQNRPEVVVVNYQMPRMFGPQVIKEIRAIEASEGRRPSIIILESGLESNLDDYLRSPDRETDLALTMPTPMNVLALAGASRKIQAAKAGSQLLSDDSLDRLACEVLAGSTMERSTVCREKLSRPLNALDLMMLEANVVFFGPSFFCSSQGERVPESIRLAITNILEEVPESLIAVMERARELRVVIDSLNIEHTLLQAGSSMWAELNGMGLIDQFLDVKAGGSLPDEFFGKLRTSLENAVERKDLGTMPVPSDFPCAEERGKWTYIKGLIRGIIVPITRKRALELRERDIDAIAEYALLRMNNLVLDQFKGGVSCLQFSARAINTLNTSRRRMAAIAEDPAAIFEESTWQ